MALIYNAQFDKNTRKLSFEDKAGNEIYSFTVPERVTVDDITKPLTFKATQDGSTVTLKKNGSPTGGFQTSRDGGNTWTDYAIGTAITLNTGDEVSFRAKADRTSAQSDTAYFYFEMTGKIEAWHNVMSMYRTNDFATYDTVVGYAFNYLFEDCTSLVKAPVLPATRLYTRCYYYMFSGCTSLKEAPELPATRLSDSCYEYMFYGCTSLTEAHELPATILSSFCCRSMFQGCTSLKEAPELPATALANSCYASMFAGCTSLTKAPELPATVLYENCYYSMFEGCTSLTKAPELPATTLYKGCYGAMFSDCTSLTKAPVLPATTLANSCYCGMFMRCLRLNEVHCYMPYTISAKDIPTYTADGFGGTYPWLERVSWTGTFYTNEDANWSSGESGIPENWRRVNERGPAVDDLSKPLTFRATQDSSTVSLKQNGSIAGSFQTSRDGGNTWADYTIGTSITLNTGDEVSFRAKADRTSAQSDTAYFYFEMTGKIEAWDNVMSMYRTNDFATYDTVVDYAFNHLFEGCTSLVKAPVLPATTLASDCYEFMFAGCTSLKEAPELPATTLIGNCYGYMFSGCISLEKAPVLSATTLAPSCYNSMFNGCGRLNEVYCHMPSSYSSSDISSYARSWLEGVSSTGMFYTNADANWSSGASGIPENWRRVNERGPAVDDITKPLTFRATQDGSTVSLTKNKSPSGSFQTSRDGGKTWTDYTIGTSITLNTGDEVSFRAKADRTSAQSNTAYFYFEMEGKIEAWDNVMSMYRTNDFATYDTVVGYAFNHLFEDCASLVKAPVLPATTLASDCYMRMFSSCISLTKAPELPATTLASYCYEFMFAVCISLEKAPVLSATTLASYCYYNMFNGCRSLNEVHCKMPSSYSSSDISSYARSWLYGVSSTGTFYTNADANWPSGSNGIPTGWTRSNI